VVDEKEPVAPPGQFIAAPEPQPAVLGDAEEEAQPSAIERPQLSGVGGTQPTALDEAELTRVQGAQPIAEEATCPTEQETQVAVPAGAQPTGKKPASPKKGSQKRQRREPIKRGGRPRESTEGLDKKTKPRRLKPEIVCWKRESQWVPAVEVPEELLEKCGLEVLQNGSPLKQDEELEKAFWCLEQVCGEVIVRWNEAEAVQEAKVGIDQEDYLLFKLSGKNLDQGRLVKSPSWGSYLVIAPDTWERDETLSGPAPVMPEQVSLAGFKAHFFELDKNGDQDIAFRTPNGESKVIKKKANRFELIGIRIDDVIDKIGPIFLEGHPRILDMNEKKWKGVKTIVVGEEGSGRKRWKISFTPDHNKNEQDFPSDFLEKKIGWYFVRFYDDKNNLIDSLDFRLITCLKEIKLPVLGIFPYRDGYKSVHVELIHAKDCIIKPENNKKNIQIEIKDDRTILTVPPDPDYDLSYWLVSLGDDHLQVKIGILVERIWWTLGEVNHVPSQWSDRLVVLSRDDFAATSNKALWLRLPRRRWIDKVLVGFERSKARPYNVRITENTIVVPLRDFVDSQEISNKVRDYFFKIWIERDNEFHEGIIAIIRSSKYLEYFKFGYGRKKTAIAKATIQNGSGTIKINGHDWRYYFRTAPPKARQFLEKLIEMKEVQEKLSKHEINIIVHGSHPTTMRQPKAVAHAIARALMNYDPCLAPLLRQAGFGGVKVKVSDRRISDESNRNSKSD
jgi:small subunit ribosomal protein S9